jgi:O-methyltransferase
MKLVASRPPLCLLMTGAKYNAVHEVVATSGYPMEKVKLVKGIVEETIPATIPASIALLRLDTDWYSSTKHEMEHL